jgi:hypothetical protein
MNRVCARFKNFWGPMTLPLQIFFYLIILLKEEMNKNIDNLPDEQLPAAELNYENKQERGVSNSNDEHNLVDYFAQIGSKG